MAEQGAFKRINGQSFIESIVFLKEDSNLVKFILLHINRWVIQMFIVKMSI